jgi:tetratricopeptide (TPR) repeat protein
MNEKDINPPQADRRPGIFGLTFKQKRLLRITFLSLVVIGAALGAYYYVSSAPQRGEQQFQDAMRLMKPGYYQVAIEEFDRALKTWPNLPECRFERGNANRILGHEDEAMADYEKAVDLNPNLYRAYAAIGSIYRDKHDYKRAMEAYTKSINARSSVDAYFERGQTYESLGEHQKAVEDYNRAIREMPDAPEVYRARGLARRNLGDEAGYRADRDEANRIEHRR